MKNITFKIENDFERLTLLEIFVQAERHFDKMSDLAQSSDEFEAELDSMELATKWKQQVEGLHF